MQRNEKQELVGALREKMVKAAIAIAVGYKNLDAAATVKLRKTFRESKVDYKVVKNTLARLAAKGTPLEKFTEGLDGPNAIILGYDDVVVPAKVLRDVLREQGEKMTVKAGVVQGNLVDAKSLAALADMPGLPELRGMLVGMIAGPATKLVRLLSTPGGQIAPGAQGEVGEGGLAALRPRKRTLFNILLRCKRRAVKRTELSWLT